MREFEIKSELIIAASYLDPKIREYADASDELHEIVTVVAEVLTKHNISNQWYGRFLREEAGLLKENGLYAQINDEGVATIAGLSARKKAESMILAITKSKKETKVG